MLRIAILASGSGTNAERLVEFFRESDLACVKLIATNNPKAGVIPRAEAQNVETLVFDPKTEIQQTLSVLVQKADVVLLAGYLRMIPAEWTRAFQGRMLNIHPALLPKFGGKGMYGKHVHRAVSEAGETQSGITIHLVNEHYDEGAVLAQFTVEIDAGEDPVSIEAKVRELELDFYGPTVEGWIEHMTLNQ